MGNKNISKKIEEELNAQEIHPTHRIRRIISEKRRLQNFRDQNPNHIYVPYKKKKEFDISRAAKKRIKYEISYCEKNNLDTLIISIDKEKDDIDEIKSFLSNKYKNLKYEFIEIKQKVQRKARSFEVPEFIKNHKKAI